MMADADKVTKALELCASGCDDNGCVYLEEQNNRGGLAVCRCVDLMARDALELLKQYSGLAKALEQSNAVNEHLNAEIERLKLQEKELKAIIENQKMYPHW